MIGLDDDDGAPGPLPSVQGIGDVGGETLLELGAAGVALHHRDWKNILERAGLADQGFTFPALRHTFATTLLRQNVNPKIVQHQLGHATISQTMDTYSHVMPDVGDVAADALEAALS